MLTTGDYTTNRRERKNPIASFRLTGAPDPFSIERFQFWIDAQALKVDISFLPPSTSTNQLVTSESKAFQNARPLLLTPAIVLLGPPRRPPTSLVPSPPTGPPSVVDGGTMLSFPSMPHLKRPNMSSLSYPALRCNPSSLNNP
jgi:hypothetical protein